MPFMTMTIPLTRGQLHRWHGTSELTNMTAVVIHDTSVTPAHAGHSWS